MTKNKELEFKTIITEEQYEKLLKEFDLENNIFSQTNYYFDTEESKLLNDHIVLRIRQKGENYKLTKKTEAKVGAEETHLFISKENALEMIEKGFDAKVMELPFYVTNVARLTTLRASTPYMTGTLFLDKSIYYGHTDYEIEYEVDEIIEGQINFDNFLESHGIKYQESIRKSKRAFDNKQ